MALEVQIFIHIFFFHTYENLENILIKYYTSPNFSGMCRSLVILFCAPTDSIQN